MGNKNNQFTPHVVVVILNWNTWEDTVECLESLLKCKYDNFTILLIDNGSENNSKEMIRLWSTGDSRHKIESNFENLISPATEKPVKLYEYKLESINEYKLPRQDNSKKINSKSIIFLESSQNLGFAKAVNLGWNIANKNFSIKYFMILNNDTVIDTYTIGKLVAFLEGSKNTGVASSTVYNYYHSDIIDQAGGKISIFGRTKYLRKVEAGKAHKISFVNGCALMMRTDLIRKLGLFTENFFFGEEDVEFSLRMKKNKIQMVSIADSIVYHKVGRTSKEYFRNNFGKVTIHRLNRIVNMKSFFARPIWSIWKYFSLVYFFWTNFFVYGISLKDSIENIIEINKFANSNSSVPKDQVLKYTGKQ